ncbi:MULTISPECIES: antiviral RADAR system adenosine triphosphatase RdrA [Pectobacterium]|uniref:antiviral RADAR system adenosine triphosphatase RdrA n=1 Tax=Pectobacterium TaxID=122277 RepID=UPI000CD0B9FA|nr:MULTISPECIES: antiviral RADAR system adenosine triphosphatase RdrA [Pectobacterium]MCA6917747.1 hypothetical protein [Pectobacterium versatile]MCH5051478.1 hypothetical protein [Pectobacterium aquaticum]POE02299.1 hypothetical protein BV916_16110 [Pectobacterium odoriferum]RRO05843.1 hypothetical protein DMB83_000245 [Pectobacterium aquaticum]RRO10121.1 hypothetical protein DMB81_003055 [Pectobacterium aquaticum]
MEKIIFDLDLTEYESDFMSEESTVESSGLWQKAASVRLVDRLKEMGASAREYKKKRIDSNDFQKDKLSCYHHAIFISGTRGAGKTIFLRNVEAIWKKQNHRQMDAPKLYFIDTIDPTLLHIEDRFSEVVIASIYAAVEKELKNTINKECCKDKFLKTLKQLSNALGNKSEFEDLRGIDRIQKYRSGIHLERYFHQFLIASVEILDCDALVLPIDDLDMKIDNAFGVLDDIRCLLSCPLILPIVSGDDDLYRHTTTMKFEGVLAKNTYASNFDKGKESAQKLSYAYLEKIFPIHSRLLLQPISQLLPKLTIKYSKEHAFDACTSMTYQDYIHDFNLFFYAFCHDAEYRKYTTVSNKTAWLEPNSARELVQIVRLFHPADLKNANDLYNTNYTNRKNLWQRFKGLAEIKRKGQAFVDAISYIYIEEESTAEELSLYNLISFNPIMQSDMYSWGESDYYKIQNLCRAQVNSNTDNRVSSEDSSRRNGSYVKTLWEMPPIEFKKLYFNSKPGNTTTELELIYTYSEDNKRHDILFGRAFEILFWSLLTVTGNIKKENFDILFIKIFKRYHFHSYLSFDADDISMRTSEIKLSDSDKKNIKEILGSINSWIDENNEMLKKFNKKNLIPLMSEVFFNVFSQLHRMKIEPGILKVKRDFFNITVLRFEYIFMNSLLCCMKTNKIMEIDVAITDSSEKITSRHEFFNSNKNIKRNFSDILEIDKKVPSEVFKNVAKESLSNIGLLLEIMWKHPIFALTEKYVEAPNYRIQHDPTRRA